MFIVGQYWQDEGLPQPALGFIGFSWQSRDRVVQLALTPASKDNLISANASLPRLLPSALPLLKTINRPRHLA